MAAPTAAPTPAEEVPRGPHWYPGMDAGQARQARRLELPVLLAVLATVPVLVANSYDPDGWLGTVLTVLNYLIWTVFLVEFIVMLRIVPDNRGWARHNVLDIAVLVLTPPFLPGPFQVLWVLRLLRILDLLPVVNRVFTVSGLRYAAFLVFIAVFGGGLAYEELEDGKDAFDGVWWAMTTITTVGYGDEYPESTAGRVMGMALMLVGPVVIGLVASAMGSIVQEKIEEDVSEIREDLDDLDDDLEEIQDTGDEVLDALHRIERRLDKLERRVS